MNRLDHLLAVFGLERRSSEYNPAFAPDAWRRGVPSAGVVSPSTLLSNSAVAARCVGMRAELSASTSLKMFERLSNGDRRRVDDHPLAVVLSDLANPLQTSFEVREFLVRSLDLHGNAYARIERDGAGQVTALYPMDATRVTPERLENGRLRYKYSSDRGTVVLLMEECLHIRGSADGDSLLGKSPLAIARNALRLGVTLNDTAQQLAENTFRPHGFLRHPGKLSQQAKRNVEGAFLGTGDYPTPTIGGVRVLEEGIEFQRTQFTAEDAALLASREMSNIDVCHAYAIPPAVLGLTDTVSYGSAAEAARALIQNSLAPLAARVEQAIQRCCLSAPARQRYFVEHDLRSLARGNLAERFASYRIAREIGLNSINELRRAENEPAIDGGDDHTPLSLAVRGEPPEASAKP